MMKVYVYKDLHVEGLVLRKANPISSRGNISLLFNGEEGFLIKEVGDAIKRFCMCPRCNSSIGVDVAYKSDTPTKIQLEGDGAVPVYASERTTGYIYYEWRCLDDHGRKCSSSKFLLKATPPAPKPDSWRRENR